MPYGTALWAPCSGKSWARTRTGCPARCQSCPAAALLAEHFLVLGVHADHRLPGRGELLDLAVDVPKLRVAVRVAGTLGGPRGALPGRTPRPRGSAPTARTRSAGSPPNSRAPRATVDSATRAPRATRRTPPYPNTRAAAPNARRRCRSSRWGSNAANASPSTTSVCFVTPRSYGPTTPSDP